MSDSNQELFAKLQAAAGQPMTREQIREQKISFILGTIGEKNNMTRAEISALLDRKEGKIA